MARSAKTSSSEDDGADLLRELHERLLTISQAGSGKLEILIRQKVRDKQKFLVIILPGVPDYRSDLTTTDFKRVLDRLNGTN